MQKLLPKKPEGCQQVHSDHYQFQQKEQISSLESVITISLFFIKLVIKINITCKVDGSGCVVLSVTKRDFFTTLKINKYIYVTRLDYHTF